MVNVIINRMRALVSNDEGQDLIEYALLAGLISLVAVGAIGVAGGHVNTIFEKISGELGTAAAAQ